MRSLPALLLVAGLVLSVAFSFLFVDRGPFEKTPVGIESAQVTLAREIGSRDASEPNPGTLYPRLLATVSPAFGRLLAPIAADGDAAGAGRRVLTAVTLPALLLLVFALARRASGSAMAGALAAIAAGFSAPFVLAAGSFDPAMLAAVLALGALVAAQDARGALRWGTAGALAGLAARFLPAVGWILGIALIVWLVTRREVRRIPALGAVMGAWLVAAAASSLLGPGEPLLPRISPIEFFHGHRAAARGLAPQRVDEDLTRWWGPMELRAASARDLGRQPSGGEIDAWCLRQGWAGLTAAPGHALQRGGVKAIAVLQGEALPREVGPRFLAERSEKPGLSISLWVGRLLLPLGLGALVMSGRRSGGALYAGLAVGVAAAWVGYAQPGYQLVALGAAGAGLAMWLPLVRTGKAAGSRIAGAAAIGALFAVAPLAGAVPGLGVGSIDHEYLGLHYLREDRGSPAMREFDRALRLDEENPFPRIAIADMLARDQVAAEAIGELAAVRERHPDLIQPRTFLASLYERQEQWPEAAAVFEELSRLDPFRADFRNNIGTSLIRAGYYDRAEAAFRAALDVDPDHETSRANLRALVERGFALPDSVGAGEPASAQEYATLVVAAIRAQDLSAADSLLASAYRRFGRDDVSLRFTEATVRIQQGRGEEGILILESLRPAMGNNEVFLHNLAAAYAGSGRLDEGIAIWEDLLRRNPSNDMVRRSLERARREREGER